VIEQAGFLRHIRNCNRFDPERFMPFRVDGKRVGLIRRNQAAALTDYPEIFSVGAESIALDPRFDSFDARSAAIDEAVERLVARGLVPKWRNEFFDVAARWGEPPLFKLDRGALPFFGVRAYGVHVNGYYRAGTGDGGDLRLWIGRRAADKKVAPDKLDNMVAGGIGHGHGVEETLVKEAAEEADVPEPLARRAVPVGAVVYRLETTDGLRDDALFCYDLALPPDFVPRNTDGEIAHFQDMPARDALERVRDGDEFKFNVALVMIHFGLRHGLIRPDHPEYFDLVTGLAGSRGSATAR
jgi:8-oxo-dGTP pyrophosphatase MutT (NUDIX family)